MKVSVCMLTYNHGLFIEKAINGVLSQKGNFEIELVIANDCSSDNTDEVIRRCIKDNKSKHKINYINNQTNIGVMPNFKKALLACNGHFLALCEGDDYWTDENKIEIQVQFLLNNPDFSLCFHEVSIDNSGVIEKDSITIKSNEISTIFDLAIGNYIHTCSVLYNNKKRIILPKNFSQAKIGDYFLHMLYAKNGNIGYLNKNMANYRVHNQSYWSSKQQNEREKIWINFIYFILPNFNFKVKKVLKKQIYKLEISKLTNIQRKLLKIKLFFS